jgi:hypothetical protein
MSRSIKAWSLCVVWETGEEQVITGIPHYASKGIDEFLDELEVEAQAEEDRLDELDGDSVYYGA